MNTPPAPQSAPKSSKKANLVNAKAPPNTIEVNVSQEQDFLPISTDSVVALVNDFIQFSGVKYDEVAIHFVDTPTISRLHSEFFDDPTSTDCISFPIDPPDGKGYLVMGDVFVCPETAHSYVASHDGNVYKEITLYVTHGLLHLLGYDDIEEEDIVKMRAAEANYLAHVSEKHLWIHS